MQAMNRGGAAYLKRSGPALDKETVLGLALRLGCPRDNPAVTASFGNILMQSMDSIEKTIHNQQRQLRIYQDACNQLIRCLITAGAEPRNKVCHQKEISIAIMRRSSYGLLCFSGDAMDH
jgi:hypothetical protein